MANRGLWQIVCGGDFLGARVCGADVDIRGEGDEVMQGIASRSVYVPLEMKMGSARVSRVADLSEKLSSRDVLSRHYKDGATVGVKSHGAIWMHDKNQVSVSRNFVVAVRNDAFVHCANARACFGTEIDAFVLVTSPTMMSAHASEVSPYSSALEWPQQIGQQCAFCEWSACRCDPFITRRFRQKA